MIPLKQTHEFIPGKQNGNCWVACLASIFNCKIEDFPEVTLGKDWNSYFDEVRFAISNKGYRYEEHECTSYGEDRNKIIYEDLKAHNVDGYVIAIGESPRATHDLFFLHAVVWSYETGIVFDPHVSNLGIKYPLWYGVFYKIGF